MPYSICVKMLSDAGAASIEEREGFEPSVPFGTHDFQSCPFGHSGTSPAFYFFEERVGVEPTLDLRPNLISNQALSATQPPLRILISTT